MNYFFCLYAKSRTVFGQRRSFLTKKTPEKPLFWGFFQPNQIASSRQFVETLRRKWLGISHVSGKYRGSDNSKSDRYRTASDPHIFEKCFINPYKI